MATPFKFRYCLQARPVPKQSYTRKSKKKQSFHPIRRPSPLSGLSPPAARDPARGQPRPSGKRRREENKPSGTAPLRHCLPGPVDSGVTGALASGSGPTRSQRLLSDWPRSKLRVPVHRHGDQCDRPGPRRVPGPMRCDSPGRKWPAGTSRSGRGEHEARP